MDGFRIEGDGPLTPIGVVTELPLGPLSLPAFGDPSGSDQTLTRNRTFA